MRFECSIGHDLSHWSNNVRRLCCMAAVYLCRRADLANSNCSSLCGMAAPDLELIAVFDQVLDRRGAYALRCPSSCKLCLSRCRTRSYCLHRLSSELCRNTSCRLRPLNRNIALMMDFLVVIFLLIPSVFVCQSQQSEQWEE